MGGLSAGGCSPWRGSEPYHSPAFVGFRHDVVSLLHIVLGFGDKVFIMDPDKRGMTFDLSGNHVQHPFCKQLLVYSVWTFREGVFSSVGSGGGLPRSQTKK